jgi:hypothetical protein
MKIRPLPQLLLSIVALALHVAFWPISYGLQVRATTWALQRIGGEPIPHGQYVAASLVCVIAFMALLASVCWAGVRIANAIDRGQSQSVEIDREKLQEMIEEAERRGAQRERDRLRVPNRAETFSLTIDKFRRGPA